MVCRLHYHGDIWGWPTLDVFAGSAKGQHYAQRYYTLYYAPGSYGINGMHQHWAADARVTGSTRLLWLFPHSL